LIHRLKNTTDVDGKSILYNSTLFFSSEIEDGNSHSHYNMPILVAGNAGGKRTPGRHLRFSGTPPVANLLLTLLQNVGVSASSFGDSNGTIAGL
jgi:hypothetical protein